MTVQAHEVAMEALAQCQDTHRDTRRLIEQVRAAYDTPADLRTIDLDATTPRETVQGSGRSIAVLNPTAVTVYLGVGGGSADPAARGIPVPPVSLLVLPVGVTNPEIGVDPADPSLGGNTAVVYVLLFDTVQAAFLGSM